MKKKHFEQIVISKKSIINISRRNRYDKKRKMERELCVYDKAIIMDNDGSWKSEREAYV